MSQPADLSYGVLLRVAEFLRKLPADQLADLAEGTAKLEVVPKAGRARAGAGAAARPLPMPAGQLRAELAKIGDRAAARRWLEDQRLTAPQLKGLAIEFGISVPSKATKSAVLDQLVQQTIGRQLDSIAVSRPAYPPR